MELDKNCWYWYTDPREGDVWYPCYVRDDGQILIDNHEHSMGLFEGLTFEKAILPTDKD